MSQLFINRIQVYNRAGKLPTTRLQSNLTKKTTIPSLPPCTTTLKPPQAGLLPVLLLSLYGSAQSAQNRRPNRVLPLSTWAPDLMMSFEPSSACINRTQVDLLVNHHLGRLSLSFFTWAWLHVSGPHLAHKRVDSSNLCPHVAEVSGMVTTHPGQPVSSSFAWSLRAECVQGNRRASLFRHAPRWGCYTLLHLNCCHPDNTDSRKAEALQVSDPWTPASCRCWKYGIRAKCMVRA